MFIHEVISFGIRADSFHISSGMRGQHLIKSFA